MLLQQLGGGAEPWPGSRRRPDTTRPVRGEGGGGGAPLRSRRGWMSESTLRRMRGTAGEVLEGEQVVCVRAHAVAPEVAGAGAELAGQFRPRPGQLKSIPMTRRSTSVTPSQASRRRISSRSATTSGSSRPSGEAEACRAVNRAQRQGAALRRELGLRGRVEAARLPARARSVRAPDDHRLQAPP